MIENQRFKVTTPQYWSYKKVKRPLLSYRGKVWVSIAIGYLVFAFLAIHVIAELTAKHN